MIALLSPVPPAVSEIDFDFYSTAAQVIPLIFIALAFEFRGQGNQFLPRELVGDVPTDPGDTRTAEASVEGRGILLWAAAYTVLMTVILAAGEVVALLVIANDTIWLGSRFIVAATLVIGALGIMVPIGVQQYNTWTRVHRLQARARGAPTKEAEEPAVQNVPQRALQIVGAVFGLIAGLVGLIPFLIDLVR